MLDPLVLPAQITGYCTGGTYCMFSLKPLVNIPKSPFLVRVLCMYTYIYIYIHTHNVHIYIYTHIYIYNIYIYIYIYYIILYYIIIYPKNEKLNSNVLVNQYSTVHVWARRPGRLRNAKVRAQLLTRSALSWGQGDHSDHSGRYFSL